MYKLINVKVTLKISKYDGRNNLSDLTSFKKEKRLKINGGDTQVP
jgi:hypothetical protein